LGEKLTKKEKLLLIYEKLYHFYGPQHWWPADNWFEVTIGAILTQNTTWKNVEKSIHNIKQNNLMNPNKLYELEKNELAKIIKSSGFYNLKSERIKNFLEWLKAYDFEYSNIRKKSYTELRRELLNIKGIGKETADSILLYAFNYPVFVVDSYTKRLFNRLGFELSDNYDEIQNFFENMLEQDEKLYNEFHALIVKHSKELCKNKPICTECFLQKQCNFYIKGFGR
jgi:endonuclease-3 related protein